MSAEAPTDAASGRRRKVFIETYGCQMNVADSELMAGGLSDAGFELADRLDDADVILMNTCAVREKAEERIYGRASQLLRFKYTRPEVILGITGCMAEHLKERIAERAPYVDLIVGPDAYRRLPDLIDRAGCGSPIVDVRLDRSETYEGMSPARAGGVSGWISIQRGCDKFCTFCIVPYTRGRERGTSPREVLRQARELAEMGYREVTLLGQTVNSYRYEDVDFADLLRSVAAIDGLARVRYTSPYPVDFSERLIDALAELPNVPNYLHLPVQSGSDAVLERMQRGYTVDQFRRLVDRLRERLPDLALSTDVIVGFPDETDADYEATLRLVDEVQFDFAFTFAYSEREGTFASKRLADTVPDATKQERLSALIDRQEAIGLERYSRWVGRDVVVLAEGPARRGSGWFGKTEDFKTAVFEPPAGVRPGDLVTVRVAAATAHSLYDAANKVTAP
ncbi:MAG: tRNA (N6-isopentenyl adenosine(37)-C2)-methylthiotransferase MiaB [Myxococcales bacterium]|nr:tRNA (N6-isopentenyl adenosine(37)-C2)-methylthiotransferase MiaB [Myxococcales bacterium]